MLVLLPPAGFGVFGQPHRFIRAHLARAGDAVEFQPAQHRVEALRIHFIARVRDELVTSAPVLAELERSPALALLAPLPLLDDVEEVDELVAVYFQHRLMPRDAAGDARHLALATFHECAILATWNCRHIANANKQEHIRRVNSSLGYATPVLTTPYELLERLP